MLKLFVYVQDNQEIIDRVLAAASSAGAGVLGKYTGCAFVTRGIGNWQPQSGANPAIGEIGKYSARAQSQGSF